MLLRSECGWDVHQLPTQCPAARALYFLTFTRTLFSPALLGFDPELHGHRQTPCCRATSLAQSQETRVKDGQLHFPEIQT